MYLVLSPTVSKRVPVHHQSLGRVITVFTNLESLKQIPASSRVLVFFDPSLDFQKLLDLYAILNLQYEFIVTDSETSQIVENHFKTHIVDYSQVDGSLVNALLLGDTVALHALQRDKDDRFSIEKKAKYSEQLSTLLTSPSLTEQMREVIEGYLAMFASNQELQNQYSEEKRTFLEMTKQLAESRLALNKMSGDVASFISTLVEVNNSNRALIALSVLRENAVIHLPQHLTSLHLRDYGIPNVFRLLAALYDSLTVHYRKHVKVVFIGEPDSIDINRMPQNYCLLDGSVQQEDLLRYDYFGCIGNVQLPLETLFSTSAFNSLIICDSRKTDATLIEGETLTLNLAPDIDTVKALGLLDEITVTPSRRSKYVLHDEVISQEAKFGSRNAKLVTQIVNTLLERRGEV
jgi:hypothetical protein